jgi:hypothetical protein
MALGIVIDGRRVRDFGIGTYIRSLVHALSRIDTANHYTVVTGPGEARVWGPLPENFRIALYAGDDHAYSDHLRFPIFLRRLKPDLVHIPLNRVPLLMIRPYVVTVHDMVNLYYDERTLSAAHMQLRRFRFRRGLMRASRVIAVSEATKRDVENLMGVPSGRITRVYNAPDPGFLGRDPAAGEEERRRIMERYQIDRPFLLYAGAIRHHKNIPRLVEAFAVLREQLAAHPVYGDLRLVIIGDTISQYPAVRQAVLKSQDGARRALPGLRAVRNAALLLRGGGSVRLPVAPRRFRLAAAGSDGLRHSGGHLQRELAARSGGRRGHAGEPGQRIRYRARHPRGADRRAAARRVDPPRPRPGRPLQLGALRPRGARNLPGRGARGIVPRFAAARDCGLPPSRN